MITQFSKCFRKVGPHTTWAQSILHRSELLKHHRHPRRSGWYPTKLTETTQHCELYLASKREPGPRQVSQWRILGQGQGNTWRLYRGWLRDLNCLSVSPLPQICFLRVETVLFVDRDGTVPGSIWFNCSWMHIYLSKSGLWLSIIYRPYSNLRNDLFRITYIWVNYNDLTATSL